ncbi:hypothetical protein PRABACTJOHN_00593 [Parabacteroides johnsonii DSM 18315]|uniref:Uncharacterized protein n=1 Tax=Parabacteroides johnsonii DSM 18315 TaxID=537006 RepID=B7B6E9_9BACT|nr:hypothetical protein PRABACTJOHN_00593 [Parabacteroides johnsonii DSM 18315]
MTRIRLYIVFFRTTLLTSIVIEVALAFLAFILHSRDFIGSMLLFTPTFGLGMDLLYKEGSMLPEGNQRKRRINPLRLLSSRLILVSFRTY